MSPKSSTALLSSQLYDENTFYHKFTQDLLQSRQEVIIESPYITSGRMKGFRSVFNKILAKGVKIVPLSAVEGEAPRPIEQTSRVEFYIERDDQDPLYLEQKSKGFRWFSSFNLRLRALGVEDHIIKNLVILIDEPGQGLHEKAQLDVKKVIEESGVKDTRII